MAYDNGSTSAPEVGDDPTLSLGLGQAAFDDVVVFDGDYRVLQQFEDPSTTLYKQQQHTPPLPVPELRHSLSMYVRVSLRLRRVVGVFGASSLPPPPPPPPPPPLGATWV